MTPVAVKEFFDSDAFTREFDFYNRAGKLCSHPNLLAIIGAYTNAENKNCIVASGAKNNDVDFVATGATMTPRDQTWRANTLTGKAEAL